MKDYIQRHHPNLGCGKQRTQDSLRKIVKEAWDSVSSEDLVRLIESMTASFQAVLDADGGPTQISRPENIPATCSDLRLG
ncbi:Bgt-50934 [Blumeria graminis f. sp. tritici]|uniref:Bgt-50934 n=1 Tax=Blumeria graminis f. sp. tritici TaxID=62690 RepID=A0A9X9QDZ8_BLUGR|nr:Bgt-50934 [Blumeria graminis f. sp. tritici]